MNARRLEVFDGAPQKQIVRPQAASGIARPADQVSRRGAVQGQQYGGDWLAPMLGDQEMRFLTPWCVIAERA